MSDKKAAQALASALAREDKLGAVKVVSPSLYGIICFIPENVPTDDLSSCIKTIPKPRESLPIGRTNCTSKVKNTLMMLSSLLLP